MATNLSFGSLALCTTPLLYIFSVVYEAGEERRGEGGLDILLDHLNLILLGYFSTTFIWQGGGALFPYF